MVPHFIIPSNLNACVHAHLQTKHRTYLRKIKELNLIGCGWQMRNLQIVKVFVVSMLDGEMFCAFKVVFYSQSERKQRSFLVYCLCI